MRRFLLYIATIAILGFGCTAEPENDVDPSGGRKITLNVSIGDLKASYAPDGNGLKCSWAAGDSIAVVSLRNGVAASVDVFKAQAAGHTALFSGRYTGKLTDPVIAIYPVLKGNQTEGYRSRTLPGNQTGMLFLRRGGSTLAFSTGRAYVFSQSDNASLEHIPLSEVMTGTVDINSNGGNVAMTKRSSLIQLTLSIPDLSAQESVLSMSLSSSEGTPFTDQSATLSLSNATTVWSTSDPANTAVLHFGSLSHGSFAGFTCPSKTLTAYLPVLPNTSTPALQGDAARTLTITVTTDKAVYSAQKVIPAKTGSDYDYPLASGTLNRLSATLDWSSDVDPVSHWVKIINSVADVDVEADKLRNEILNSESDWSTITGTKYYVSSAGSDSNSGTSEAAPFKTLSKVNSITLHPGDGVLFRRGDLWRGTVTLKDGVTYSAYGTGDKPRIYNSINVAQQGSWSTTSVANVYKYSASISHSQDIGTLVFNDGDDGCAYKVVLRRDYQGNGYHPDTMQPFNSWQDLKRDRDMFHDKETGYLYLCSTAGNPATRWTSIEASRKGNTFNGYNTGQDWLTCYVDNICIKYTGSHGVGTGHVKNLTVTNCEIGWIGGSLQNDNGDTKLPTSPGQYSRPVRYGNGVEIWGWCDKFNVSHNYIYQVYDAAISPQYSSDGNVTGKWMNNISFEDNLIERSVYAIEYWLSVNADYVELSGFRNYVIRGNIMRTAGEYGWGYQRFNKETPAIIQTGNSATNHAVNFKIEGNIIDRGKPQLLRIKSGKPEWLPECRDNVYLQENGIPVGDMIESNPKIIYVN